MADDTKLQQTTEVAEEAEMLRRRDFLKSLKKWSQAVIGGIVLGEVVSHNTAAGWVNHGGGGTAWANHGRAWANRGGAWANHGGGGGATWANRGGGGAWANHGRAWANRGGAWLNAR